MSRYSFVFLMSAVICQARGDFYYPDFTNTPELSLNGDAHVVSGRLRLTDDQAWSSGSAFTTTQVALGVDATFSTYFQFQITGSGGIGDESGAGADGLVFVIQTVSNNVGGSGGGIGYQGISPSVGIEFDTFYNSWDPNGNHVGVDVNGGLASWTTAGEQQAFNHGDVWNVWIDYDGASHGLDVYWSMTNDRSTAARLSYALDIPGLLGSDAGYVGFTSATGDGWNAHDILNWRFSQQLGAGVVPEPGSFTLLALGGLTAITISSRAAKIRRISPSRLKTRLFNAAADTSIRMTSLYHKWYQAP